MQKLPARFHPSLGQFKTDHTTRAQPNAPFPNPEKVLIRNHRILETAPRYQRLYCSGWGDPSQSPVGLGYGLRLTRKFAAARCLAMSVRRGSESDWAAPTGRADSPAGPHHHSGLLWREKTSPFEAYLARSGLRVLSESEAYPLCRFVG